MLRRILIPTLGLFAIMTFGSIAANAQCSDAWVSQAINELKGRGPFGSGNSGECRIQNYGGGSWTSYQDLKNKVWAASAGVIATAYENEPYSTRLCLDTQSFASGSPLVAAQCHGQKSQQFVIASNRLIRHTTEGMCLDGGNGNGGRVVTKPCSGSRTQQWFVNNIPDADNIPRTMNQARGRKSSMVMGQIQNQGNSMCVDIKGASQRGGEMIMYPCHGGIDRAWNQMFAFSPLISYGKAYIFSRWHTPVGMGHTAWAVRLLDHPNGHQRWMIGGFDGTLDAAVSKGRDNGWFIAVIEGQNAENDVINYFSRNSVPGQNPAIMDFQKYTHYKIYAGNPANPAASMSVAYRSKDWGYGVFGNNCIDQTWKVLNSYGIPINRPGRMRMPWEPEDRNAIIPNLWFQQQNGPEYVIR